MYLHHQRLYCGGPNYGWLHTVYHGIRKQLMAPLDRKPGTKRQNDQLQVTMDLEYLYLYSRGDILD